MEKFASLDRDMVTRACGRFRGRVKAVIEAGGDFIEKSNSHIPIMLVSF